MQVIPQCTSLVRCISLLYHSDLSHRLGEGYVSVSSNSRDAVALRDSVRFCHFYEVEFQGPAEFVSDLGFWR